MFRPRQRAVDLLALAEHFALEDEDLHADGAVGGARFRRRSRAHQDIGEYGNCRFTFDDSLNERQLL